MSFFNRPYRTDPEMEADEKNRLRKFRIKNRESANNLANKIYQAVVDAIETGGEDNFSKEEMVAKVAGERKLSISEKFIYGIACNSAIAKTRRYFWSDDKEVTDRRMFNYVRDQGRYWLVPLEVNNEGKLATNVIYEEYDRKVKGLHLRMRKIATSAYLNLLKMNKEERNQLILELRKQKLLNGGG